MQDAVSRPLVIAHRGASGYLPEHSLAAHAMGVALGADLIELDVTLSRDGGLLCLHDLTLDRVTDVAARFPGRARADGLHYVIDFDVAEVESLELLGAPGRRIAGAGLHPVSMEAICAWLVGAGRPAGLIVEPKDPGFHRDAGRPIEGLLKAMLDRHGYRGAGDGCMIQTFDPGALRRLRFEHGAGVPLVRLTGESMGAGALDALVGVGAAIGPNKALLEPDGALAREARARGLGVYPYTFGDDARETHRFFHAHDVDGLFTDFADVALYARDAAEPTALISRGVGASAGASATHPEHTLAAIREAVRLGVSMIELDVRFSADGVPVVIRDARLDRTTDGSGAVEGRTLDEITRLDAGAWKGGAFTGERVPTLAQASSCVPEGVWIVARVHDDARAEHAREALSRDGRVAFALIDGAGRPAPGQAAHARFRFYDGGPPAPSVVVSDLARGWKPVCRGGPDGLGEALSRGVRFVVGSDVAGLAQAWASEGSA